MYIYIAIHVAISIIPSQSPYYYIYFMFSIYTCAESNQHSDLRDKVCKRNLETAEKMENRYNASKKIKMIKNEIGDAVIVQVLIKHH